jgi:hypothetical protein
LGIKYGSVFNISRDWIDSDKSMKITVDKRGMNIVNGNHHELILTLVKLKQMNITNENHHGNQQMEIVICGMKINMGNEK